MNSEERYLPGVLEGQLCGRSVEELLEWKNNLAPWFFGKDGRFDVSSTMGGAHKVNRQNFVSELIRFIYDFVRYSDSGSQVFFKRHGESDYTKITDSALTEMVTEWFDRLFHNSDANEVTSTVKNIKNHIIDKANIRNGITRIMPGVYWNAKESCMQSDFTDGCFLQLAGPDKVFSSDRERYSKIISDSLNEFYSLLEQKTSEGKQFWQFYKELPIEFHSIWEWADEAVPETKDRYWDMMMTFSLPFMRTYIKKAIMLLGGTRCAKSTFLDLIKFEFGQFATGIRISQLGDKDINNELASSFINIPDEEITERNTTLSSVACANFKTLVTHKEILVGAKYKTDGVTIDGKFPFILAGNRPPKWSKGDEESCMQRMIFIRFVHFFGNNDIEDFDFIRDKVIANPEHYARFLGVRLAIAKYFSQKGRTYFVSDEAKSLNEFVSVDDNSITLYKKLWNKYFDGVSRLEFHYDDYRYCCEAFGWVMQSKGDFRNVFIDLHANKPEPRSVDGRSIRCVRVPKFKPARVLYPDLHVPSHGTAEHLHDMRQSIVAIYEQEEIKRKEEKEAKEIDRKSAQQELTKYLSKKSAKAILGDSYDEYFEDEDE